MRVWVNGIERADIAWRALPQDILAAVDDEAAQSGNILSELYVDGRLVSREYFCELALEEWDTANFILTPFMDFLREALTDAEGYSRKLFNGIEALVARLELARAQDYAQGNLTNIMSALNGEAGIAAIIDGVNWLIGIYERGKIFAPVPLRPDEDVMLQSEILNILERLLDLRFELQTQESQDSQFGNNIDTCDCDQEFDHAHDTCQKIIICLREELLPRVQILEYRVSDIAQAAQMPVQ